MSVYTTVTPDDLAAWLTRFALGPVRAFEPIAAGIENTNSFLTTDKSRYVLTLYERLPAQELPFYLNLMAHLARAGVTAPAPEPDRTGALFSFLNGKPAGLVAWLAGAPVERPDSAHCAAVGRALAQLHVAAKQYRGRLANRRGTAWLRQAARAVRGLLSAEQNALLSGELRRQTGFAKARLPRGAIHGDLFCDNVLFVDGRVSGIIDFGFAATDAFAYDLAITVNDWCVWQDGDREGELDTGRTLALVGAYDAVRPLTFDERALWGPLLRAAALRFWLSRLCDLHLPRQGELTHAHDPAVFERILRNRIAVEPRFPEL
jgi:homoserine kinase type II